MELECPPPEVVWTHPAMQEGAEGEETGAVLLEGEKTDVEGDREGWRWEGGAAEGEGWMWEGTAVEGER